jgi:hypothetical protein
MLNWPLYLSFLLTEEDRMKCHTIRPSHKALLATLPALQWNELDPFDFEEDAAAPAERKACTMRSALKINNPSLNEE